MRIQAVAAWSARVRAVMRSLFRRRVVDHELDAELQFFIDHQVDRYRQAGASADDAARLAKRSVGSVLWIREACREARGTRLIDEVAQDVRRALRMMRRHFTFAVVTVALMAMSIGVSASAVALLDAVLFRALPAITKPSELALVSGVSLDDDRKGQTVPMFELLSKQRDGVAHVFAYRNYGGLPGTIGGTTVPLRGIGVLGEYFEALQSVPLVVGHVFDPNGDGPEALISTHVWQLHFGGAPDVVGRTFTMGTVAFTVVGIVGPEFLGLQPDLPWDVITPFTTLNRARGLSPAASRSQIVYTTVRLKPGVTPAQYQSRLKGIWPEILRLSRPADTTLDVWSNQRGPRVVVESLRSGQAFTLVTNPGLPRALKLTAVLSSMVFVASCLTLGLLVVARAARHQRDTATRLALGGSWWRVVRPFCIESICLATLGCAGGLVFASWGSQYASWYVPGDWRIGLMPWAVLCAVAMAVFAAIMEAGLLAFVTSRGSLRDLIQRTSGSTTVYRNLRAVLLGAQVVASAVLVYGTLLYISDMRRLDAIPTGLDVQHLRVYQLSGTLPYRTLDAGYFQRLEGALHEVRGIQAVGIGGGQPPLAYLRDLTEPIDANSERRVSGFVSCVFPGVLASWRTPLIAGRDVQWTDGPAAVLTESLAKRLYPNVTPIGHVIRTLTPKPVEYEVVGVVANMAFNGPRLGTRDVAFVPCLQRTVPFPSNYLVDVYVRSPTRGLEDLKPDISAAVERLGTQFVLNEVDQEMLLAYSVQQERMLATLGATFGGFVVLLTSISLYAFATYTLTLRTRELAVRAALGARPMLLVWEILRELSVVLSIGGMIGLVVAIAVHSGLRSTLGTLAPVQARTPVIVAAVLLVVFIAASAWPAVRAARLVPASGLGRDE